ncbi:MAG TPA: ornithine cyclodeaminase family protein [Candidatus Acidoferrales bacterium]|nr:ornithine cyclodeaminase family protein [Candidatus Acidoferrales bacterium]
MALVVSREETEKLIDMPAALGVIEQMFRDRAAGKLTSVARQRISGSDKKLNFMAAWHRESDLICLRAYAGPSNTITLYDGATGQTLAVFNANYLSALRTGAASGVAAKFLAPERSRRAGLIGAGRQAFFQVEALYHSNGVNDVIIYSRNPERRQRFISEMTRTLPLKFTVASSIEDVEAEADILVVATDSTVPVVNGTALKNPCLVISMGANQPVKHEVSGSLLELMDAVVVDDLATAKIDSGDLIDACAAGLLRWDRMIALERLVSGDEANPRGGRVLFKSHGIADEDLAVASYIWQRARQKINAREVPEI